MSNGDCDSFHTTTVQNNHSIVFFVFFLSTKKLDVHKLRGVWNEHKVIPDATVCITNVGLHSGGTCGPSAEKSRCGCYDPLFSEGSIKWNVSDE